MRNNYALIIGIEDYSAYDHDVGNPEGTSDLGWAVNDALAYVHQCLALGMLPERICVLTSPALGSTVLGPNTDAVCRGPANRGGVLDGLAWLSDVLSDQEPASGLLVFSGHGEWVHGIELCPSDTMDDLDEVICLDRVRRELGSRSLDDLHVLFDAYHVQSGCARVPSLGDRLARRASPGEGVRVQRGAADSHEHILASCQREQSAVAAQLDGKVMSAFTWAMTSVLRTCHVVEDGSVLRLDESYAELARRASSLLNASAFQQIPVLAGSPETPSLPFLQPSWHRA